MKTAAISRLLFMNMQLKRLSRSAAQRLQKAQSCLKTFTRAVNIAMVNEMKVVLDKMGIDVWEVVDAAATKPFGFQAFYPGPGLGGHCIPIDPFYLTWKAREVGVSTKFIELAGEVNHAMPDYVVDKTVWGLNQQDKSIKDAKVLVMGLAYKPDVDDVRESPSFELIERLLKLGANVDYNDPHVAETHEMRKYNLGMKSVSLDNIEEYDAVVISTNHSAYNWQTIAEKAKLIIDSRGANAWSQRKYRTYYWCIIGHLALKDWSCYGTL